MRVRINGQDVSRPGPEPLGRFLEEWGLLSKPAIAVARNGDILPRADWPRVILREGDEIDIVQAAAGG